MLFPASDPQSPRTPGAPLDDGTPVKPIGPERLRALREAILAGTYPLEAAAQSGLASMFGSGGCTPPAKSSVGKPRAAAGLAGEPPVSAPRKPTDPR